jgi:type II secretory pathway predicted ATPase ExeA
MTDIVTFHGLRHPPFDKAIRTRDVVDTAPLSECTARLDYIKRRGGIMLLVGDPGVGKTLALRRFADNLNDNLYVPVYTPLTTLKSMDLLRHLNSRLGLDPRASKSAIYDQIQAKILDSREQRGKTVVIIIDEAHLLATEPLQELRLLTNFKMDSFDPFILVLAGHTELARTMDFAVHEPLSQRLALRYHMPPLDPEETATYVNAHMKLAGATSPIFGDDALAAIHEVSYGIPRRIGRIAEQALTYAMFADKKTVDADMILRVKAGG